MAVSTLEVYPEPQDGPPQQCHDRMATRGLTVSEVSRRTTLQSLMQVRPHWPLSIESPCETWYVLPARVGVEASSRVAT
jgi:hypothetical protein